MAQALEGYFTKKTAPQLVLVASVPVSFSIAFDHFLSSLDVWIRRPQVVNKRLLGAVVKDDYFLNNDANSDVNTAKCQTKRLTRELIPKQRGLPRGWETILISESSKTATFHCHKTIESAWTVSYQFKLIDAEGNCEDGTAKPRIELHCASAHSPSAETVHEGTVKDSSDPAFNCANRSTVPSDDWLRDVLLVKIAKWAQEASLKSGSQDQTSQKGLVSLDRFAAVYAAMKEKYGKKLVDSWSESTDPQKFVYEDIAIAAYLIILWEDDRERLGLEKKQSFVDLGCGNGLLVHLLNCEGYPGKGIDLKKRKIWKMFQPLTMLEERSIVPSDSNLFPECDWLLGNHSDELTPWIPLIAARSSYTANFFVLPCCCYDFVGKFSRPSTSKSQYRCYLDYVAQIGKVVGFRVEEDTLRIPSSKRICFIGRERTYRCCEEEKIEATRKVFLVQRCKGKTPSLNGTDSHMEDTELPDSWCSHFEPRPQEIVRKNCIQIDPQLSVHIVNTVAETILSCPLRTNGTVKTSGEESALQWKRGEGMKLDQVAALFDSSVLQHLKQEYGGLQTLLKNHHQVFEIVSGKVHIRDWTLQDCDLPPSKKMKNKKKSMPKKSSSMFVKTKMCWFALHHPDGCPLGAQSCSYAHSREELSPRPLFEPQFPSDQT